MSKDSELSHLILESSQQLRQVDGEWRKDNQPEENGATVGAPNASATEAHFCSALGVEKGFQTVYQTMPVPNVGLS